MKVAAFDFDLPPRLIAQHPAVPRDSARMLVVEGAGLTNASVRDLPARLEPGDVLVVNDTRVIPARLPGTIDAAKVEATLHKRVGPKSWRAFAKPGRKFKPGARVAFAGGLAATVAARGEGGEIELLFDVGDAALDAAVAGAGIMPLPPYIKRPKEQTRWCHADDMADYQTLFAARDGAVAAPTAGLHFTPALADALKARGIGIAVVTLHVGAGTFLPVKTETVEEHRMHAEWGEIGQAAADAVNAARKAGRRIVAVGSTATRLLETAAAPDGTLAPFAGETAIFIVPGYRFRAVDMMLTNFHLPRSTLFMLVSAFAGTETMKRAYAHAIAHDYRFYSYGDCCLLTRAGESSCERTPPGVTRGSNDAPLSGRGDAA